MTDISLIASEKTISGEAAEVPFGPEEMFFSRTDGRGVIEASNDVFLRVSRMTYEETIGAPHKVVRHPDMPKGAFWLMWERLKSGQPTGLFVRNRAKDGCYYRVLALALPIEGGYLSVRIKPVTPLVDEIESIYGDMRQAEKDGATVEQSAAILLERLKLMGFDHYDAFQAEALARETEARMKSMKRNVGERQQRFRLCGHAINQVQAEASEMVTAIKMIAAVPMNMRIVASRLEDAGKPISAISVNYASVLNEMDTWVRTFFQGDSSIFATIRDTILRAQFLSFAALTLSEMSKALLNEHRDAENGNADQELALIDALGNEYFELTERSLGVVATQATKLGHSVLSMKRYVMGLGSTRMMCKIENAAMAGSGTNLLGIVEQLDKCQDQIEEHLSRIMERNIIIQNNTQVMRMRM